MAADSVNDASRSVTDYSRVTLQIMAYLTIVIYDCNKFIVKAIVSLQAPQKGYSQPVAHRFNKWNK